MGSGVVDSRLETLRQEIVLYYFVKYANLRWESHYLSIIQFSALAPPPTGAAQQAVSCFVSDSSALPKPRSAYNYSTTSNHPLSRLPLFLSPTLPLSPRSLPFIKPDQMEPAKYY
jgi:hypothetical protein